MLRGNIPALGTRFDIDKIEAGGYTAASWRVFWESIAPEDIKGVSLFDGDTGATLGRQENVFCIAVQCTDRAVLALGILDAVATDWNTDDDVLFWRAAAAYNLWNADKTDASRATGARLRVNEFLRNEANRTVSAQAVNTMRGLLNKLP